MYYTLSWTRAEERSHVHDRESTATAAKRRRAATGFRGSREDRAGPKGVGDDRLRLETRERRRVLDQAQHHANRQSLERRVETLAAPGRRRTGGVASGIDQGNEGPPPRGPSTLATGRRG